MNVAMVAEKIPIETDTDGVVRVGKTRVTMDILVEAFNGGSTAEEIVYQFPVLNLADVYAVITYYLRNRDSVESYLKKRKQLSAQIKQRNQASKNMDEIRTRLLARKDP